MTAAQVQLLMMLTDRVFLLVENMKKVSTMSEEAVQREIDKERRIKDSLVYDVTL